MADSLLRPIVKEIASHDPATSLSGVGSIAVVDKMPPAAALGLSTCSGFQHVVQRHYPMFDREIEASENMLTRPRTFLDFPASSILCSFEASAIKETEVCNLRCTFDSATKRTEGLQEFRNFLATYVKSPALREKILFVCDETTNNALIHGHGKHAGGQKPSLLFAAHDNERILVGVTDYFGALKTSDLLTRIQKFYEADRRVSLEAARKGGIGCILSFDSSISCYIAVEKGRQTTVCWMFPNRRLTIPVACPNLHWLEIDEKTIPT